VNTRRFALLRDRVRGFCQLGGCRYPALVALISTCIVFFPQYCECIYLNLVIDLTESGSMTRLEHGYVIPSYSIPFQPERGRVLPLMSYSLSKESSPHY